MQAQATYKQANWQVSATGFYYHIKDYILGINQPDMDVMTIGASGVKQYQNIPYATLAGFDATVTASIHKHIKFISGFGYTYGIDNAGAALPLVPPAETNTTVKYQRKKWFAQLEADGALAQHRFSHAFGEDATPGYLVLNLR